MKNSPNGELPLESSLFRRAIRLEPVVESEARTRLIVRLRVIAAVGTPIIGPIRLPIVSAVMTMIVATAAMMATTVVTAMMTAAMMTATAVTPMVVAATMSTRVTAASTGLGRLDATERQGTHYYGQNREPQKTTHC